MCSLCRGRACLGRSSFSIPHKRPSCKERYRVRQVAQPRSLPFRDMQLAFDDIGAGPCVVLILGGLVAMDQATAHPERWWAIGLVTTTAQPVTRQEREVRRERAGLVERDGMQVLIDYMHTGLYGPQTTPELRSRVDTMMARAPAAGAAAALRGRAERPDYRPRLRELDIPTFV